MKNLLFFLGVFAFIFSVNAQNTSSNNLIPVDSALRYGKLDNGLTYYIRHNNTPKNRADFYFVQRVGSTVENDSQRGLAHFLEHMAFNGTEHFPDKDMIRFLERNGVKFGENLNAYTGFDETVYYISDLPTTNEAVVDSALLILRDWAGGITISAEEIEKERGVIKEEWRTRGGAQFRIWEKLFPEAFAGSKYANRLPIGTLETIENFEPDTLRRFFRDWYRPDLQAVVVVGDISEEKVLARIDSLFRKNTVPKSPPERIYYPVPDNDAPIISVITDKEATQVRIDISFKNDPISKDLLGTELGAFMNYVRQVAGLMINERLSDIAQTQNPPFIHAYGYIGEYIVAKTKDAFTINGYCSDDGIETAFKALMREVTRIRRFGFTETEYDRARKKLLRLYENAYNERFNQRNKTLAQEYANHFTDGGYIPGIVYEYDLVKKIASGITAKDVGNYVNLFIDRNNSAIFITGPEKESIYYPNEYSLLSWYNAAKDEKVTAYKDLSKETPLLDKRLSVGKIEYESVDSISGTTVFGLSNGTKVIVKPTKFKTDEIRMKAYAPGGFSLFEKKDIPNSKAFNSVIELSGLGRFSKSELSKQLSGKRANLLPELSNSNQILNGVSSPSDLETLLQLTYLAFSPISRDQAAYDAYITRLKTQLENQQQNPMSIFSDSLINTLYPGKPLMKRLSLEDVEKIDYNRILKLYRELFGNGRNFTFIFVGNIDMPVFKKQIATYIGAIPASNKLLKTADIDLFIEKGTIRKSFAQPMQTPKATTVNVISGTTPYTLPNFVKMSVLNDALKLIYTEKIREEKSGTYGVGVLGQITTFPKDKGVLQIYFDTDPSRQKELNDSVLEELKKIGEKGIEEITLATIKENLTKNYHQQIEENTYWMNVLHIYYSDEVNLFTDYLSVVSGLTSGDIRDFTKSLLSQGNFIEVVMVPGE